MTVDLGDSGPQQQRFDLDELTSRLRDRAFEIFPPLFPQARYEGHELRMADISGRAPRDSGSCVVELKGSEAGSFYDHQRGQGGGPLETLAHATGLWGRELFEKAAEFVNLAPEDAQQPSKRRSRPRKLEDRTLTIASIVRDCLPAKDTLVETYLRSRGLELPADCPDILYHFCLTDGDGHVGWPAMVTRPRNPATGEFTGGIHRIYLQPDGNGKAPIPKPKLTLGPIGGGVAMLMPMVEGCIGIAEGIETALAAFQLFHIPVWAGLSDSGLAHMPFPEELRKLVIFADRGDAGEKAAATLRDRALAAKIEVEIRLPAGEDDFAKDLELGLRQTPEPPLPLSPDVPTNGGQAFENISRASAAITPPPLTIQDILAAIETLTAAPNDPMLTRVIRGIALAGLDPIGEKQCFQQIKAKTGLPIADLVKALKQLRREFATTCSSGLPTIDLSTLSFVEITEAAWAALAGANTPERFFLFGGVHCRIARHSDGTTITETLNIAKMRHILARTARWINPEDTFVEVAPPQVTVEDVLATPDPPLPELAGIVNTPVFSPSGEIETEPGYHARSGLWYAADAGFQVPTISPAPNVEQIAEAKRLILDEVLGDFPFDGPTAAATDRRGSAERAHTVALLLQPFVRPMIDGPTPIFLIDKPSPGSGAGLLVEVVHLITTGRAAIPTTEARDDDEMRKKIASVLREGRATFFLDNVRRRIDASALASAVTARVWEDRLLGESLMMRAPVRCTWIVAGNNVRTSNEIARRCIRIRIDPKTDRPEERSGFRHPDLLTWIGENRGRLVWACLTLIQAWIAAGRPEHKRILGSFDNWCRVIGGILDVVEIPGFLSNTDDMRARTDSEGAALRAFVGAWWAEHDTRRTTTAQLFAIAEKGDPPLPLGDGTDRSRKTRLGINLTRIRDRQFRIAVDSARSDEDGNPIPETIEVRVENPGSLQGAQQWNLLRLTPTVNVAEAQDQGSQRSSRPQGIDSKSVREPREAREPFPDPSARDKNTDKPRLRSNGDAQIPRWRGEDSETGSRGSQGSLSPVFPRASDGELGREPRPGPDHRFTNDDWPAGHASGQEVDADPDECEDGMTTLGAPLDSGEDDVPPDGEVVL